MPAYQNLNNKILNKSATVCIAGLGYVGLPLAKTIIDAGFESVIGLDIDIKKVNSINKGKEIINSIPSKEMKALIKKGLYATSDFSHLQKADILIICVPTPINKYKEPDLSYVISTLELSKRYIHKEMLISLESTTWPGTTEEVISELLEEWKFKVGKDIFLGYSPEREDPGNDKYTTSSIPKVVSGHTKECLKIVESFYSSFIETLVPVKNTRTAELVKLVENIQRSVNIGLMNELKVVSEKMDIDIFEVIKAAATKPFGFTEYYPGPGVGGHCIPVDPFYLTWKAKEYDIHTKFIELAGEVNDSMPNYVVDKVVEVLNKKKISLSLSKILILGLSYKKNIGDLRESPNLKILESLKSSGSKVSYSDPFFKEIPSLRDYSLNMKSVSLTPKALNSFDIVLLLTDHDEFDYTMIKKYSNYIVDVRGKFSQNKKISYA